MAVLSCVYVENDNFDSGTPGPTSYTGTSSRCTLHGLISMGTYSSATPLTGSDPHFVTLKNGSASGDTLIKVCDAINGYNNIENCGPVITDIPGRGVLFDSGINVTMSQGCMGVSLIVEGADS
jgi:hypothetical protein